MDCRQTADELLLWHSILSKTRLDAREHPGALLQRQRYYGFLMLNSLDVTVWVVPFSRAPCAVIV